MGCPICLRDFGNRKTITLECQHKYCLTCMKEYAKIQSKSFGGKFQCPDTNCNNIFSPNGLIGKRLIKEYDERNSRMSAYPCPWKKCKGTLDKTAQCNKCQKQACNICLEKPHFGICNPEIVNSINSVYKNKKIKFCPNCNTAITKNGGCPSMVCMKCGTNFNWKNMQVSQVYNFDHYQDRVRPGSQNPFYHNYPNVHHENNIPIRYPFTTRFSNMTYDLDEFDSVNSCLECGLDICIVENGNNGLCCWCNDKRVNKSQIIYDVDLGLMETNHYWKNYCPTCRSIRGLKLDGILVVD